MTLGVVKVWGVTGPITDVTMTAAEKPNATLDFTYNAEVRCFMQTYTLVMRTTRGAALKNGIYLIFILF